MNESGNGTEIIALKEIKASKMRNFNHENYGSIICKYRTLRGLTQQQLGDKLNVSKNLVGHWETGRSRPDLNLIPELCNVLEITIPEFFGIGGKMAELTFTEQHMLRHYRMMSRDSQRIAYRMIDSLLDCEDEAIRDYCRETFISIPHNEQTVCAGVFNPLEAGQAGEPVYVKGTDLTRRANEIVTVSGDSMEPTYFDGDDLLLEYASELGYGDIGVFVINGEGFVKEFRGDGVYSHNSKKYPFRKFCPGDEVRCIGRIIGRVDSDMYPSKHEKYILKQLRAEAENDKH